MPVISPDQVASITQDMRVLEIGCGTQKRVGHSTTLDFNPKSNADVIHDLNNIPYPFEDNTFDVILAEHVLEHLNQLIPVYEELYRITKPNGRIYVEVPHFSNCNYYTDPTHLHPFSTRSFDYFIPGTSLNRFQYSSIRFEKVETRLSSGESNFVARMLGRWINKHQMTYEQRFAFIFPKENVNFVLKVLKDAPSKEEI